MIEVPNAVVVVVAFAAVALLLAVVLLEVPALATRKLQIEGERIRNAVLDAVLDGDLERDEPALRPFLHFCHMVEHHTTDLRLGSVLSLHWALRLHGLDTSSEDVEEVKVPPRVEPARARAGRVAW